MGMYIGITYMGMYIGIAYMYVYVCGQRWYICI